MTDTDPPQPTPLARPPRSLLSRIFDYICCYIFFIAIIYGAVLVFVETPTLMLLVFHLSFLLYTRNFILFPIMDWLEDGDIEEEDDDDNDDDEWDPLIAFIEMLMWMQDRGVGEFGGRRVVWFNEL
ncbi:hypothetical protein P154DRAFT_573504 [Amniculicola lignicola CBS 123094]|uniref:Uncharacterized protein n=1 Tax=Amniculicola lignicola CBS 123094 TaxID=1392246 RepID=A0A6A5WNJ7_9PLEO|nr:hypothetical protein P154DRAFT_573504 [Amniculicola lignicola CBS 123094]